MPGFPIVDAHVHIYDVDRLDCPWLEAVPPIARTHTLADLDKERGPVEIDKIVFAEVAVAPGRHIEEAAWVQSIADKDPRLAGMVAHLPMEKGAIVEADIEELKAFGALRGIRRLIETERDYSFCLEPGFLEALRLLPRHNLTFDICVKHWGLVFAIELARRCPEVSFVLDHIGKPGIKHGLREPWWSQMKELARAPNVMCKVSGVITEADKQAWKPEEIMPYVAHAIECFGFDRVLYGSDWTVSKLSHAYPQWVDMIDRVIAGSSEAEQRKLYRDNAIRVYRL